MLLSTINLALAVAYDAMVLLAERLRLTHDQQHRHPHDPSPSPAAPSAVAMGRGTAQGEEGGFRAAVLVVFLLVSALVSVHYLLVSRGS